MADKEYTLLDLQVRKTASFSSANGVTTHTHQGRFGCALTLAKKHLFSDVLIGFYYTVHFSRQFGTSLVAKPVVEFVNDSDARYTLRQTTLSGD